MHILCLPQTAQAAERGHRLLFPPGAPWQPVTAALWQDAAAAVPAQVGSLKLVYREVALPIHQDLS